jgi:transposase
MIVQPETLLRWHRDFFRFVWRHKSKAEAKPGRPPLSDDDIARIKRLARENATWGAERIRGELKHLGIDVSKSTIQKVIEDERESQTPTQTWATSRATSTTATGGGWARSTRTRTVPSP